AKKIYHARQLIKDMRERGIYVRTSSMKGIAEEAGGAYKDIDEVVAAAEVAGVSRRVARFIPIGNIKG
ncbi:MAG TPA: RtcB family protein, partial [Deltaproteobacteria bacterium]|nr:RtcB family protein [Deltaproteobacteria bacterium]